MELDAENPKDEYLRVRPEISIIVPVYHVEKYLRKTIDSILRQTFSDFELILVNDGGNEEETAICKEYARKDSRIVYIYQTNQGLSAARNSGLAISRGNWIMFVDSDDWVREDFCEKALESVRSTGADMGVFDLEHVCGDNVNGIKECSNLAEGVYDGKTALEERIRGNIKVYSCNKIYRASLWKNMNFPTGEIWEDDAIIHEIIDKCKTVAVIHDVLYYQRNRDGSITADAFKDGSYTYWLYEQRRKRWKYLEEHHPEMRIIDARNLVVAILQYARRTLISGDTKGLLEARNWSKRARIPMQQVARYYRTRFFLFLHCSMLFALTEYALYWSKSRLFRAGQIGEP